MKERKKKSSWLKCPCVRAEVEEIYELDYQHCSLVTLPDEIFEFECSLKKLYLDYNQVARSKRLDSLLNFPCPKSVMFRSNTETCFLIAGFHS